MTEFELADKQFQEARTKNRVEALMKAKAKLKRLEVEAEIIRNDLKKAKEGNFIPIVEKYISINAAEEFE